MAKVLKSINRWVIPETVQTLATTRHQVGDDEIGSTYEISGPPLTTVFCPRVKELYDEYLQDNLVVDSFEYMDRAITVAKEEQFISILRDGYLNGYWWQKDFTYDLFTPGPHTCIHTWTKVIRAEAIYIENHKKVQSTRPLMFSLETLIQRGSADFIIAMHVVYGMNYDL